MDNNDTKEKTYYAETFPRVLLEAKDSLPVLMAICARTFKAKFRQSLLGIAWLAVAPFITIIVMTLIFNKFANLSSGAVPYGLYVFSGLIPWLFFANSMPLCTNSIVNAFALIRKHQFPRIYIPLSIVLIHLIDFFVAAIMFSFLMIFYQHPPSANIIFLPLFILLLMLWIIGVGLFLSALNVFFRDVRMLLPYFIQIGFILSPVGYGLKHIPEKFLFLYGLNPMAGIINGFRWSIIGADLNISLVVTSVIGSVAMFALALVVFKRAIVKMADYL